MGAVLLSRLESKPEITRFALRSALDRVRLREASPPPPPQTDHRRHGELSGTAVQGGLVDEHRGVNWLVGRHHGPRRLIDGRSVTGRCHHPMQLIIIHESR